jgi:hypothetical protein
MATALTSQANRERRDVTRFYPSLAQPWGAKPLCDISRRPDREAGPT